MRPAVDQADAEDGATPLERGMGIRCPVIDVQPFGQAAALDGRPQHLLASARVLVGHPPAVQQQARVIVDQ
jgi:hypothetical protein